MTLNSFIKQLSKFYHRHNISIYLFIFSALTYFLIQCQTFSETCSGHNLRFLKYTDLILVLQINGLKPIELYQKFWLWPNIFFFKVKLEKKIINHFLNIHRDKDFKLETKKNNNTVTGMILNLWAWPVSYIRIKLRKSPKFCSEDNSKSLLT